MNNDVTERIRARWDAPDDELRAAIRAEAWTGHNIPITAAESTLGASSELIEERVLIAVAALAGEPLGRHAA